MALARVDRWMNECYLARGGLVVRAGLGDSEDDLSWKGAAGPR